MQANALIRVPSVHWTASAGCVRACSTVIAVVECSLFVCCQRNIGVAVSVDRHMIYDATASTQLTK